jgi:hypothetical protein
MHTEPAAPSTLLSTKHAKRVVCTNAAQQRGARSSFNEFEQFAVCAEKVYSILPEAVLHCAVLLYEQDTT